MPGIQKMLKRPKFFNLGTLWLMEEQKPEHNPTTQTRALNETSCEPEPVAHTCNPSYSEDRDQEDLGSSKPAPSK
jgi:hypothetical protein